MQLSTVNAPSLGGFSRGRRSGAQSTASSSAMAPAAPQRFPIKRTRIHYDDQQIAAMIQANQTLEGMASVVEVTAPGLLAHIRKVPTLRRLYETLERGYGGAAPPRLSSAVEPSAPRPSAPSARASSESAGRPAPIAAEPSPFPRLSPAKAALGSDLSVSAAWVGAAHCAPSVDPASVLADERSTPERAMEFQVGGAGRLVVEVWSSASPASDAQDLRLVARMLRKMAQTQ